MVVLNCDINDKKCNYLLQNVMCLQRRTKTFNFLNCLINMLVFEDNDVALF